MTAVPIHHSKYRTVCNGQLSNTLCGVLKANVFHITFKVFEWYGKDRDVLIDFLNQTYLKAVVLSNQTKMVPIRFI